MVVLDKYQGRVAECSGRKDFVDADDVGVVDLFPGLDQPSLLFASQLEFFARVLATVQRALEGAYGVLSSLLRQYKAPFLLEKALYTQLGCPNMAAFFRLLVSRGERP